MAKRFSVIFPCFAPALLLLLIINCTAAAAETVTCSGIVPMTYRNDKISITDFGGVGDGRTLNTKAFREAIYRIGHLKRRGGTLLYIPPGVYLTESFNLTSHMTLYLARDAVIKATTVKFVLFFLLHSWFWNLCSVILLFYTYYCSINLKRFFDVICINYFMIIWLIGWSLH